MGSGNIDNLDIRISADANKAQKSLESLARTLDKVNKSFKGMNTVAVGNFSRNVNTLASSLRASDNVREYLRTELIKPVLDARKIYKVSIYPFSTTAFLTSASV